MKREDLYNKTLSLLPQIELDIKKELRKVMRSGCLDIQSAEDNFRLPKIVMSAILKHEAEEYEPQDASGKKEVKNVYLFT